MGYFGPSSREYSLLSCVLRDTQQQLPDQDSVNTFFGRMPAFRIDHVFLSSHFDVVAVEVPNNELLKLASDHLPVIVDVRLH